MYGYANALYLLARYFQETKCKRPPSLKVVFATAEPLFDFQRKSIQDAFGVSVAVEYGARDAGLMANECRGYPRKVRSDRRPSACRSFLFKGG